MEQYKKLSQAAQLLERVQNLDSEIIAIEKLAIQAASGDGSAFDVIIKATEPERPESSHSSDEMPDMEEMLRQHRAHMFERFGVPAFIHVQHKGRGQRPESSHNFGVGDSLALKILSVILSDKIDEREAVKARIAAIMKAVQ